MALIEQFCARKVACFRKLEPGFDAAFAFSNAIMVHNTMQPDATHLAYRTIRENRRVFYWNVPLIIKPIGNPCANGHGIQPAFIHPHMKRMFVMIASLANVAE